MNVRREDRPSGVEPVPRIEALVVGTEVVSGFTLERNVHFLARLLNERGYGLKGWRVLPDDHEALTEAFRKAMEDTDVLIVSGGLGPTPDDHTKESLAAAFDLDLVLDQSALEDLESKYRRAGLVVDERGFRQVRIPAGSTAIPNRLGSAPGLHLRQGRTDFFLLPGVPAEFRGMVAEYLVPWLERSFPGESVDSAVLRTTGIPESMLAAKLEDVREELASISTGFYPHGGGVDLRIAARGPGGHDKPLEYYAGLLKERLGKWVYAEDQVDIAEVVGNALVARGETVAVAESCTGGLLGARITDIPGSSRFYVGGVVAYADEVKSRLLEIPAPVIGERGAVSGIVARLMAAGVRRKLESTWGLSVSGVAGPAGGTATKPVGTVFLGLAGPGGDFARRFRFFGERVHVRNRSVVTALDWLRRALEGSDDSEPISHWEEVVSSEA